MRDQTSRRPYDNPTNAKDGARCCLSDDEASRLYATLSPEDKEKVISLIESLQAGQSVA